MLLADFINTAFNLLSVGSVNVLVSALCSKVVNAVMIIYGFILPISFCLGMFSLAGRSSILGLAQSDIGHDPMLIVMFGLGAFHCMIAIACVSVALVVLRPALQGRVSSAAARPRPSAQTGAKVEVDEPRTTLMVARPYELPPVHGRSLFWKEMHLGMNSYVYSPLFYTGLGLSIAMLVFQFSGDEPIHESPPALDRVQPRIGCLA